MEHQLLTVTDLAAILRSLRVHDNRRPHIVVEFNDPRVEWSSLGRCTNHGLPALDHGQRGDCRWSLAGGQSLHAHWYPRHVEFHLDLVDPRRKPLGHLVRDTNLPTGVGLGALMLGLATQSWEGALAGAVLGAAVAAVAHTGASSYWTLVGSGLDERWEVARLLKSKCSSAFVYA